MKRKQCLLLKDHDNIMNSFYDRLPLSESTESLAINSEFLTGWSLPHIMAYPRVEPLMICFNGLFPLGESLDRLMLRFATPSPLPHLSHLPFPLYQILPLFLKGFGRMYSSTRIGRTRIPRNYVFLEYFWFSPSNSSLFLLKMFSFVEKFEDSTRILRTVRRSFR